jgi:hypothetical protein
MIFELKLLIQFLIDFVVLSSDSHETWNLQDPAEEPEPDMDDTEHDLFGTQSEDAPEPAEDEQKPPAQRPRPAKGLPFKIKTSTGGYRQITVPGSTPAAKRPRIANEASLIYGTQGIG